MKHFVLSSCLAGYLVFSSLPPLHGAELVTKSRRSESHPSPLTVVVATPDEVRGMKTEVPNEHDAHQPLRLPELGGVPDVDLQEDPIYQELLKVFRGAMQEPGGQVRDSDDRTAKDKFPPRKEREAEERNKPQKSQSKHHAAPYHAAEKLLKIARSLEKPAEKLEKLDHDIEAKKLRKAISKIRAIVSELVASEPDETDRD